MIARQGDILIISVDGIPDEAAENGRVAHQPIVLALGEATGHSHTIVTPEVKWFGNMDTVQYVQSDNPFEVVHQEHATLCLPPGSYVVVRQVEYTPAEIRRVLD